MIRVLAISAFALFSIVAAGTAMAQERAVLQDISATGRIGSGTAGVQDIQWMRDLLAQPETVYGRVWGKDVPGKKIYVETGGGALVTVRLSERSNMEQLKLVGVGNDVEIQAYRITRKLGTGSEQADVPEGDPYMLTINIIRPTVAPSNLTPQAGYDPDTDRGIRSRDASDMGGVGGQCFNCYEGKTDYK
jgi:hypothetical protein